MIQLAEMGLEELGHAKGLDPEDLCLASNSHSTESVFGGRIECQHAEVQRHCSCSCWHAACHETAGTLVLHDHAYGLDDASVTNSLGRGFHAVRLHSNEGQICWVAGKRSKATCTQSTPCVLNERELLSGLLHHFRELVEKTKTGTRVDNLPRQPSIEPFVEGHQTLVPHHVTHDGQRPCCFCSPCQQLNAHLDHVNRLDACRGKHPSQRARGKWLHGLPHRRVGSHVTKPLRPIRKK